MKTFADLGFYSILRKLFVSITMNILYMVFWIQFSFFVKGHNDSFLRDFIYFGFSWNTKRFFFVCDGNRHYISIPVNVCVYICVRLLHVWIVKSFDLSAYFSQSERINWLIVLSYCWRRFLLQKCKSFEHFSSIKQNRKVCNLMKL